MSTLDLYLIGVILGSGILGVFAGTSRTSIAFVLTLVVSTILYAFPGISGFFKGPEPIGKIFLFLLVLFIALVIFGLLMRIIRGMTATVFHGPWNRIVGLTLGLIVGAVISGAIIWGIDIYGRWSWKILVKDSKLAPGALVFFNYIMAFTTKMFPHPEKPWWKIW